jgi:hypothetical protein
MSGWTAAELETIGGMDEIRISSRRPDGSLRPFVIVWVVRAAEELYVRSAYGPDNGWFRRAVASGEGRISAGGLERDVRFERPGTEVDEELHGAYRVKYDGHGPRLVGMMVSADAARCTLRLMPQQDATGAAS